MRLSAINLPGWQPVQVAADKASIVGRSSQSDIVIPDPRVSGRHALFEFKGGRWTITDLASKHGVRVQGVVAAPNRPVEIVAGDLVHLGPVAMRFGEGSATTTISRAFDDGPGTIIAPPTPGQGPALTQKMIEAIAGVIAATHDRELAQRLADLTVDLSCYPRVAVLDVPSAEIGEVRVLAAAPLTSSVSTLRLSRSLVRSAMDGQLVVLRGDEVPTTHSIMSLDIKEACCAPIRVGDTRSCTRTHAASKGPARACPTKWCACLRKSAAWRGGTCSGPSFPSGSSSWSAISRPRGACRNA
jgi:hypothetical protein